MYDGSWPLPGLCINGWRSRHEKTFRDESGKRATMQVPPVRRVHGAFRDPPLGGHRGKIQSEMVPDNAIDAILHTG